MSRSKKLYFGDNENGSEKDDAQRERLRLIRYEKIELIKRARKLQQDHDVIWKHEIFSLAQLMEEELLILDQDWLVSSISGEIRRLYIENGIKIAKHVADYLPARFKRPGKSGSSDDPEDDNEDDEEIDDQENIEPSRVESSEQGIHTGNCVVNAKKIVQLIDELPRDEVADLDAVLIQGHKQLEKRSAKEQIPLLGDSISSGTSSKAPQVTTDMPPVKPGTLTQEALGRVIKKLQAVYERVPKFPAQILEKDKEIALGWDTWICWADAALDLKYSQTWLDWFKTEKNRDIFGKHAAAVMSFAVTNLCANCSDEKNKEWVRMEPVYASSHSSYQCLLCNYKIDTICPACNLSMKLMEKPSVGWKCSECEGTVPMRRDLTREQVGDKSSIVMDEAMNICVHMPNNVAFCLWYNDWIQPYIAGRKKRLGPDLSEKA